MEWCEKNQVDYVLGMARNERLRGRIDEEMAQAAQLREQTQQPARVFAEFPYRTQKSWGRQRRVVAKAEQMEGKENPRYVVTSLRAEDWPAQRLYEELYCQRGEMENRIKEQLTLFATRVSAETLAANQVRLYLSALAYVLVHGLRRLGLQGTEWARAQATTIRLRLVQDRCAYPDHDPQGVDLAGLELSVANHLCARLGATAQLSSLRRLRKPKQTNNDTKNRIEEIRRRTVVKKPISGLHRRRWLVSLHADWTGRGRHSSWCTIQGHPAVFFAPFPTRVRDAG
jgi:hypothetical protein